MLKLHIPESDEFFDEDKSEFMSFPAVDLELEHSLTSLATWESKWEIPFLSDKEKTDEQTLDYIKCMTLTNDVAPEVYLRLDADHYKKVSTYIDAKMTATWFSEDKPNQKKSRVIITAEIIYHWMVTLNIPFECQHWHLARLLTLVKVCNQQNSPPEKLSRQQVIDRNRELNEQRKAQLGTSG